MNILIIEPRLYGHHGVWLKWLVHGLIDNDASVIIGTREEEAKHPVLSSLSESCGDKVKIITVPFQDIVHARNGVSGLIVKELRYHKLFKTLFTAASRSWPVDAVFIPYLDYCVNAIGILGSPFGDISWSAVIMRPIFHHKKMGIKSNSSIINTFKKVLFIKVLLNKKLIRCFAIDETLEEYFIKFLPKYAERLAYMPDPVVINGVDTKDTARKKYNIPSEAIVILVYGALTLRKGIDVLLEAFNTNSIVNNIHLLIVGKQDDEVEELIKESGARIDLRIHQINSYVSAEEEYAAFKAADLVWMGYKNHFQMSGVMVQAGKMGLPVIACGDGLIGYMTLKYNTGVVLQKVNAIETVSAISYLLANPSKKKEFSINARKTYSHHSIKLAVNKIYEALTMPA